MLRLRFLIELKTHHYALVNVNLEYWKVIPLEKSHKLVFYNG